MAIPTNDSYDFIIVGAGIGGTVVASRLHQRDPSLSILLVEAGPDPSKTSIAEFASVPANAPFLQGSELDWNYETLPQVNLDGKVGYARGGKGVGGGALTNYGLWTRGDAKDYDDWADLSGSKRWSWSGMLPYFRKSEHHHDANPDLTLHGVDGPVKIVTPTSSGRKYPLREPVLAAWKELGIEEHSDANDGNPLGLAEVVEARANGARVNITVGYPLAGVTVLTDTLVKRVVISESKTAKGVEFATGKIITAKKEVILSAGSIRTPQLLILSGVGPTSELQNHEVEEVLINEEVGKNLWDHLVTFQLWKLRHPELGLAFGSEKWTDPKFSEGNQVDWWVVQSVPEEGLKEALKTDNSGVQDDHSLLASPRSHLGLVVYYIGAPGIMDGSVTTTMTLNYLPTSRGTVTLKSSNPEDSPVIDHNHFSTEKDRYCFRSGARKILEFVNTTSGKDIIVGEFVPPGREPLVLGATDEEIDVRVKDQSQTIFHPAGTASMGKVVDAELNVIGIKGLRVVDASVLPTPISGPIQACVYALAEQAVDIILGS